jgi:hypothetical protein
VVGHPDPFGPYETYLALSTRLDPARALEASDVVDGGSAITFVSKGTTCYRVALDVTGAQSRSFLQRAVEDWASGRTHTSIDPSDDVVGFTVCDPGKSAPDPSSPRFHAAIALLELRSQLTVSVAKGHDDADLARCDARVFFEQPGAEQLMLSIGDNEPSAAQLARLRRMESVAAQACRDDSDAGLG